MRLPDELGVLGRRLREIGDRVREEAKRVRANLDAKGSESTALAAMMRPNLGATPAPLRRVLEPLIAVTAAVVIASLLAFGLYGFAMFFLAASLIYLILTFVFGLEIDLNLPV